MFALKNINYWIIIYCLLNRFLYTWDKNALEMFITILATSTVNKAYLLKNQFLWCLLCGNWMRWNQYGSCRHDSAQCSSSKHTNYLLKTYSYLGNIFSTICYFSLSLTSLKCPYRQNFYFPIWFYIPISMNVGEKNFQFG